MLAQLLQMPITFVVPIESLEEPYRTIANSADFQEARKKVLEKCINEDKYFQSQRKKRDVGLGFAEEHFMDFYFPGFDDAIAAVYKYRYVKTLNQDNCNSCKNQYFFNIQSQEMRDFIRRYRNYRESKLKREFTFEEASDDFRDKYCLGWTAGFRVGFCGLVCQSRDDGVCPFGNAYSIVFVDREEWMQSVHGGCVDSE